MSKQNEKILIAEDHELYSDGVSLLLREIMPDAEILHAVDFPSTIETLSLEKDISIVMLDIKLPGTKNLDGLKQIRMQYPTITIIVVSTLDFDVRIRQMIDLGANGFIAKSTSKSDMQSAIREILDGSIVVKSEKKGMEFVDLTPRQLQTLEYLAEGLTNKDIAQRLNVSPLTAREYVSQIIHRLNATNRTQAVLIAQKYGLLIDHL